MHSFSQTGKLVVNVRGIETSKGGELSTGIFLASNFPKVGKLHVQFEYQSYV